VIVFSPSRHDDGNTRNAGDGGSCHLRQVYQTKIHIKPIVWHAILKRKILSALVQNLCRRLLCADQKIYMPQIQRRNLPAEAYE